MKRMKDDVKQASILISKARLGHNQDKARFYFATGDYFWTAIHLAWAKNEHYRLLQAQQGIPWGIMPRLNYRQLKRQSENYSVSKNISAFSS